MYGSAIARIDTRSRGRRREPLAYLAIEISLMVAGSPSLIGLPSTLLWKGPRTAFKTDSSVRNAPSTATYSTLTVRDSSRCRRNIEAALGAW